MPCLGYVRRLGWSKVVVYISLLSASSLSLSFEDPDVQVGGNSDWQLYVMLSDVEDDVVTRSAVRRGCRKRQVRNAVATNRTSELESAA
jgi:hypothetical protein